ncbi:MAG: 23S rRNA (uracil(1939)-C(5))-methyltransferase RlmD [Bacteroidales bacterium]|nr:23S rRNA (uracil(1939)-C(5))-methyltransferase RlmD [Bacteroidales bacterium]MCF8339049.1 23S rRNA (uracil(1939)-C(5))-methyltransferase RlmD [Bacteroidales bacterium]
MGRRKKPLLEQVTITDAGSEGKSIGRANEKVVFVPFAAPGDVVDIQVTKKRKSYYEGKVVRFHQKSPRRVEPFCEHFGVCGGCKWQHMSYEDQLFYKQKQVTDNLERIGKMDTSFVSSILPSPNDRYYRNKLEFSFSDRRWIDAGEPNLEPDSREHLGLGFHIPGLFDKVEDVKHCYLMEEPANKIRLETKRYTLENGYTYYNPRKWEGLLRNLVIRTTNTGDVLVNLVVKDADKEKVFPLLDHLADTFPEITSLFYTVNPKKNDSLSDLEATHYSGKDHIIEQMEDLYFKIGPLSFFQTNSQQAYRLYQVVRDFASLRGGETVYDLYTGTGTIANFIAKNAGKVVGVEYVEDAIKDARENAVRNNIDNTEFVAGDMMKIFDDTFVANHGKPDVVITDPPRAGMHPDVVHQLNDLAPGRIVYVSCNAATQARDVNMMLDRYRVKAIQPVDMFPQTHHVENVLLLEKKA